MAATIILRDTDKRLSLANAFASRKLAMGSDWNTVRVAFLLECTDPGAAPTGGVRLSWGLCSDRKNVIDDNDGVAVYTGNCYLNTWKDFTYGGDSGSPAKKLVQMDTYPVTNCGGHVKKGAAITNIGNYYWNLQVPAVAGTANSPFRSVYALEVRKGTPNWQAYAFAMRTNWNPLSVATNETQFAQIVEAGWAAMVAGHCSYQGPMSFNPQEATYGALDSIFFYWNRSVPQIEISEVRVTKID